MSYHISLHGHPSKVSVKLKEELAKNPCHIKHEEEIRQLSGAAALKSIEALGSDAHGVKVELSGSASDYSSEEHKHMNTNNFSATVTPLYGFLAVDK